MNRGAVLSEPVIAWGVAARALPGQVVSGDLHLVMSFNGGVLLAAVDGIGHGVEAMTAADLAVRTLQLHPEEPPVSLIRRCHAALMRTRGVVMTLASVRTSEGEMAWLGVGDVEAAMFRADPRPGGAKPAAERVILRSGLVGYELPALFASHTPIGRGDLLVFVTDGVAPGFADGWARSDSPQQIADCIMEQHFKQTDDALALVVRYLGSGHE